MPGKYNINLKIKEQKTQLVGGGGATHVKQST